MWSHQSQPLYDDIGRFYTILLKLLQWIGVVTDVRLRARTLPFLLYITKGKIEVNGLGLTIYRSCHLEVAKLLFS